MERNFTLLKFLLDVQDTERVFKKVVYPGLETLKVVDRNGVPQVNYPGVPVNSFRSKSFILSPRGVPMKTTNHVYSGCQAHPAKVSDLVGIEFFFLFLFL